MQTLHPSTLSGTVPVQYPIIQSQARNQWIDINNESSVTLQASLGGRLYFIPPNSTVRYAMDNTETSVTFTPQSAANATTDTVSGTVYNEQDNIPVAIERGANAADILPITSAEIADGAVIAAKVATDAINTANIVNGAVVTAKIANAAITNPLLASLAVATGNIQSGAVTNATLAALAVANANIQNAAVNTAQLANGSVTTTKIANLAVTNALIANAAVGTAQIANAAITTALIANAAITTALIANLAVTNALIASVSADKITAGTITATISVTSGLIQTAISGPKVTLGGSEPERISLYGGNVSETFPGRIYNTGTLLGILAPTITGFGNPASFQVNSDGTGTFSGSHIVQADNTVWTAVNALNNGWLYWGSPFQNVKYIRDSFGIVHIEGLVKNGPTSLSVFVLPAGFRPPGEQMFTGMASGGAARIDIDTSGNVFVNNYIAGGTNAFVSLAGITFSTF